MPDAPPLPAEIVTDYAIGMYYASMSQDLSAYLLETYDTAMDRAEALAKFHLFGFNPDTLIDITPDTLKGDVPEIDYVEGINISLGRLLFQDQRTTGIDPMREFDQLLRLDGQDLQYRGVHAADWTTVLRFTDTPPKSLEAMIADLDIMGWSVDFHPELSRVFHREVSHL